MIIKNNYQVVKLEVSEYVGMVRVTAEQMNTSNKRQIGHTVFNHHERDGELKIGQWIQIGYNPHVIETELEAEKREEIVNKLAGLRRRAHINGFEGEANLLTDVITIVGAS